jgi:hypothetical protein
VSGGDLHPGANFEAPIYGNLYAGFREFLFSTILGDSVNKGAGSGGLSAHEPSRPRMVIGSSCTKL